MMPLVFGKLSDFVYKLQRRLEIRKRQLPFKMVVIDHLPFSDLTGQRPYFCSGKGRYAPSAGNARLFCESRHRKSDNRAVATSGF